MNDLREFQAQGLRMIADAIEKRARLQFKWVAGPKSPLHVYPPFLWEDVPAHPHRPGDGPDYGGLCEALCRGQLGGLRTEIDGAWVEFTCAAV